MCVLLQSLVLRCPRGAIDRPFLHRAAVSALHPWRACYHAFTLIYHPAAVLVDVLGALEALAEHAAGREALQRCGLAAAINAALRDGWLERQLVGRARALRDVVSPDEAHGRWRRRRLEESGNSAGGGGGSGAGDAAAAGVRQAGA
jgi:hypothetical protein